MRSGEYLLGKFIGNLAFLVTFLAGFMLSSMAMLLVRGEAPIEPLVFVGQYLLLTPARIIFVSAVAVLFESIRFLSGKIGDVFYFFFFMSFMGVAIGDQVSGGQMNWARCFDFSGFGFMIDQMTRTLQTTELSIGSSAFDPTKEPILFPGLRMQPEWIVPRIISMLLPLAFLPLAGLFFHRFDPVRTKAAGDKSNRNWIGRFQRLFKPLSRRAVAMLTPFARGGSLFSSIVADAVLTLTLFPLVLLAFVGIPSRASSRLFQACCRSRSQWWRLPFPTWRRAIAARERERSSSAPLGCGSVSSLGSSDLGFCSRFSCSRDHFSAPWRTAQRPSRFCSAGLLLSSRSRLRSESSAATRRRSSSSS
jgi:hypothetical protein